MMRHHAGVLAALATLFAFSAAFGADLAIPPRAASKEISIQQGPPHCRRWTDECVNCSRGADGEAPVCSNIGFACQPKAIRCLSAGAASDPQKK
jgi:hypothetical protein